MFWIQKDKRNFKNLTKFISQKDFTINNFKSQIKSLSIDNENQIWKKSRKIQAVQYGGLISNWITIATYDDKIFSIEIVISGEDAEVMKRLAKRNRKINLELKKNWKYSKEIDLDKNIIESFKYVFIDEKIKSQFENEIAKDLGQINEIEINDDLKESYEILIDPMKNYDYGYSCYYGAIKPDGRKAIEKILEAKRFDLLKNIIRGFNPEGRAYGIEAFFIAYSKNKYIISKEDEDCIKKILKSNISINKCSGCDVFSSSYDEIFPSIN